MKVEREAWQKGKEKLNKEKEAKVGELQETIQQTTELLERPGRGDKGEGAGH